MTIHSDWDPVLDYIDAADKCDYCGERLSYPIVFWSCEQDLFFHQKCAGVLGRKLTQDANTNDRP